MGDPGNGRPLEAALAQHFGGGLEKPAEGLAASLLLGFQPLPDLGHGILIPAKGKRSESRSRRPRHRSSRTGLCRNPKAETRSMAAPATRKVPATLHSTAAPAAAMESGIRPKAESIRTLTTRPR